MALRPDQLLSLAKALNVSVEDLVGTNGTKRRSTGPTGKVKQLFEAASRLQRSQQEKITTLLEPCIAHHAHGKIRRLCGLIKSIKHPHKVGRCEH